MKRFKNYEFALNIGTVKRVRDVLGVDLTQPERGDPPLIARIFDDDLFFVDILDELIPTLDIENLTGDDITEALSLFLEEWKSFFTLRGRTDRAKMIEVTKATLAEMITKTQEELGKVFTDSQESPGSIPNL